MLDVSIVTPTYNAASTVTRLLKALLTQSYNHRNFELIIIDDGSSDATQKIIQEFVNNNRTVHIRLVQQDHAGPGPARNKGIDLAKGRVVAFTDADCIPDDDWIENVVNEVLIHGHPVVSGVTYCRETIIYPWKISPAGQRGITANLAIEKTALGKSRFSGRLNGLYGEDTDLLLRVAKRSTKYQTWDSDTMRVEHPVNTLGLSQVIGRALARHHEVLLFKLYGREVYSSMHPLYRPLLFGHFSVLFAGCTTALITVIVLLSLGQQLTVAALVLFSVGFFIYGGYKIAIRGEIQGTINIKGRSKILLYFLTYNMVYLLAHFKGSIKYRKVMV
jgi:glycosyltransferase involved in cell wall biosynthesis